ncbi:MAG: tRNA uridine-5-carboxymethylaminomethyl(34) synthesis enzyme MnmG [Clostridiales bacterium]|nr:tRNA uridine-5-carboxymethylaminomethyl(34) synthesis enzyme MnmG [Clostridiales bacterium]
MAESADSCEFVGESYDVVVVGAGHAGCEAALAAARLGMKTLALCINLDSIANMPCNPSIGGTGKGHLVRELDALGGEMGKAADRNMIQSRMLNRSKGPAVFSLRAQIDRRSYQRYMKAALENQENLDVRQAEATEILLSPRAGTPAARGASGAFAATPAVAADFAADSANSAAGSAADSSANSAANSSAGSAADSSADSAADFAADSSADSAADFAAGSAADSADSEAPAGCRPSERAAPQPSVVGVRIHTGAVFPAKAVVLTTGTYLKARIVIGEYSRSSGPDGLFPANSLSGCLRAMGVRLLRFKTGTPARVNGRSLDFGRMEEQPGDDPITPFSFETDRIDIKQTPCWLTGTTEETHGIIRASLGRSPMFSGAIKGVGARYCPSIEDKVVRFPDRASHQIFVEPMGADTLEMYLQGMSSSMPEDVQERMVRSVPGLERAKIMRSAYAIEYDCIDSTQLKLSLEFRAVRGLFAAGQINGTSGYEEAAAQGLVAGVNAALALLGREPLVIDRSEGYIGVLIDDLVTKGTNEPYRMMTSRAEYRLLLRQDNADIRLTQRGRDAGLIGDARYAAFMGRKAAVEGEIDRLERKVAPPSDKVLAFLASRGSAATSTGVTMAELLRRPEITYESLSEIDPERPPLSQDMRDQAEISVKYAGYIRRQQRQVEQFRKLEGRKLPDGADYSRVRGLSAEAAQKLGLHRPASIGQASRISGVSPADVSVLLVWLAKSSAAPTAASAAAAPTL